METSPTQPPMPTLTSLRVGIVGLGLIGGSLAAALAGRCARRIGLDLDAAVTARAQASGAVDEVAGSLPALLAASDLVVLCQPVQALIDSLAQVGQAPRLPVVCDVASVKSPVLRAAREALGARRVRFVGAHPIAGKSEHGLAAAEADLFHGRTTVLCPGDADADALQAVAALWQAVGSSTIEMAPEHHDEVYAMLSHLPQFLTWAYLRTLADRPWLDQAGALAGTGFQGFTRLGRSSPALWAGIVIQNRHALLDGVGRLAHSLDTLRRALALGDAAELEALFEQARDILGPTPGSQPTKTPI